MSEPAMKYVHFGLNPAKAGETPSAREEAIRPQQWPLAAQGSAVRALQSQRPGHVGGEKFAAPADNLPV